MMDFIVVVFILYSIFTMLFFTCTILFYKVYDNAYQFLNFLLLIHVYILFASFTLLLAPPSTNLQEHNEFCKYRAELLENNLVEQITVLVNDEHVIDMGIGDSITIENGNVQTEVAIIRTLSPSEIK